VWVGLSREPGDRDLVRNAHGVPRPRRRRGSWFGGGWALGWGAVSPRVARVEVRNDDAEVFPARIVPLPPDLASSDRAAWGLAERGENECVLVGYAEDGEPLPVNDYPVAPRTQLAEGDDPIGGPWRLWIAHRGYGTLLELWNRWHGGGAGNVLSVRGGVLDRELWPGRQRQARVGDLGPRDRKGRGRRGGNAGRPQACSARRRPRKRGRSHQGVRLVPAVRGRSTTARRVRRRRRQDRVAGSPSSLIRR
jgi:hypothetical protein